MNYLNEIYELMLLHSWFRIFGTRAKRPLLAEIDGVSSTKNCAVTGTVSKLFEKKADDLET